MKKSFIPIFVLLFAMLLTGCSENYIKITDSESESIAQYCAHLLLKYDGNKNDDFRLMEYDDFIDEMEARKPSPTEIISEEPVEPENVADGETDVQEPTDDSAPSLSPTPSPTQEPTPTPVPVVYSLSEIFGYEEDFVIEYADEITTNEYKSSSEYFSLYPPEGKVIVALTFTLKNISEEEKVYDASMYPVKFELTCGNDKCYNPSLSLLTNDLQFYYCDFAPGEERNTELIFFIPQDTNPGTLKVSGTGSETESKSCTIYITNNSEVENGN